MNDYEKYEKDVKENEKRNKKFLEIFEQWLKKKGLGTKTINNHLANADLYINNFLIYYEAVKMEDGWHEINSFLGDWFIRKCMWSTEYSVKTTATSIKKFYQCMCESNFIKKEDYEELSTIIKQNMDIWIQEVNDYNNFDEFNDEEDWNF